jgi:TP901 family phage tail tape measure protein
MATIANMNVALELDDSDFSAGIARAQGSAESFSKKLGGLGQTMSLAITAPLVGIAAMAVKSAGDFEQNMNIIQQTLGATTADMAVMQKQALDLGASTVFSAGEAAEGQLELAKAGMNTMEVMAALPGVMDLAAAGGIDLATAAGLSANTINAFGLEASDATNIANMLAAAANASTASVGDLGAGIQQAGFAFSAAGQGADDLIASTAILTNVGYTGSDAGTALKNAMIRLINPTDEAAGMMNQLGIDVYDTQGNMLSWADVIDEFSIATAGLTDEERNAALSTILMSDGMKAMIPLLDEGKSGFLDMKKAISVEGSAAATANARMKGFGGAVEYLKGSIDSFLIETALPFLDSLSGIVRSAADMLTTFGELPEPVRNTALAIGAILAAAGPVLLIVSKLIPMFSMFGTVMGVIVSPIGLVVAALAALVAVFATDFMGIRTAVMGFVDSLIEMSGIDLGGIIEGFKSFGRYIGAVLEDGDYLNDWLTHLPEAIQPVVQAFGGLVATLMSDMSVGEKIGAIQADISALFTEITALDWGGAWAAFQTWLDGWAAAVVSAVKEIDWGGAVETAGNMFNVFSNVVVYYLKKIDWGGIFSTAGDLFWQLKSAVTTAIQAIEWGAITLTPPAKMTAEEADAAILAGITAVDTEFSAQMKKMVDGWATTIKDTDFTTTTVAWLDKIKTSLGDADWSGFGTTFATQLNAVFAAGEAGGESKFDFSSLDTAIANSIAGMDWALVKEKLSGIDAAFAEGLGEFNISLKTNSPLVAEFQRQLDEIIVTARWADGQLDTLRFLLDAMVSPPTLVHGIWDYFVMPFLRGVLDAKMKDPVDIFGEWGLGVLQDLWDKLQGWFSGKSVSVGASVNPNPSSGGTGFGNFNTPLAPVGPNTPLPNNRGLPIDITPPPPSGIMGDTGRNGNVIGAVYVNNSVDINELAFKVAQANQRRFA